MARTQDREQARTLRKRGVSIKDIAQKISASKSSVSYWCRDIQLSPEQLKVLTLKSTHAGRAKCIELGEQKRAIRLTNIKKQQCAGAKTVATLSQRDLYMLGLGLYWGEGYKTSNDEFGFTNSDPRMIKTYLDWLSACFGIKSEKLVLRVSINSFHQSREKEVLSFWSKLTKIPLSQFTKTSFIKSKSKKVFSDNKSYFGTLRIKVRGGMNLKYQILGAIENI